MDIGNTIETIEWNKFLANTIFFFKSSTPLTTFLPANKKTQHIVGHRKNIDLTVSTLPFIRSKDILYFISKSLSQPLTPRIIYFAI